MFEAMLAEESIVLTRNEKRRLFEQIVAEILGYGPLEQFLNTTGVTEIMVNGPRNVFIEQLDRLSTRLDVIKRLVYDIQSELMALKQDLNDDQKKN